jgi:hypothetical protein
MPCTSTGARQWQDLLAYVARVRADVDLLASFPPRYARVLQTRSRDVSAFPLTAPGSAVRLRRCALSAYWLWLAPPADQEHPLTPGNV